MNNWFKAQARGSIGEIAIYEEIGEFGVTAQDFRDALNALGSIAALRIVINSNGGDVSTGTAIYNMLARHPARKTVRVDGLAASMASVIAMAGDEIVMPSNAMMMIHNPWGGVVGDSDQIRSFGEALDVMQASIRQAYAKRTGLPIAEIAKLMDAETWLSASRAVELGFADRVEEPLRAVASVDTRRFRHVPAGYRPKPRTLDEVRPRAFANFNRRRR